MASGKTLELRQFSLLMKHRRVRTLPARSRNRALPGKKRIQARRAANRSNEW